MKKVITMMMILLSLIMMSVNSSKMMVMMFCLFTLMSAMLMTMMVKMTIIPFLMVLTVLGGISILFMYMTATIKTMKKENNMKLNLVILTVTMLTFMPSTTKENKINNLELEDNSMMVFKEESTFPLTMLMMVIMITLMTSIWSCSVIKAPLRQKMNPWIK